MATQSTIVPGLAVAMATAIAAMFVHELPFAPFTIGADARHPIDAVLIAIALGIAIRSMFPERRWIRPGAKFAVHRVLPAAIVLLGARLDFLDVMRISAQALVINVVCVVSALVFTVYLCQRTGVGQRLGLLIGVGTAICGGTAIAVTAPVIDAEDRETAFAMAAITFFGLVSIAAFPVLGAVLHLSQLEFGVWAGTSIHATAQVMAAAFAYGPDAGETAVIVKLVRVLLLAPVVAMIGAWYARQRRRQQQAHVAPHTPFTTFFPPFVFGFLLLAGARTLNLLPDFTVHLEQSVLWEAGSHAVASSALCGGLSMFLMTVAMAAIGLGVDFRELRQMGLKGFYAGLISAVALAGFSLALLNVLL